MLKMERGAVKSAGRNARVVDMEELKKRRDSRAVSARRPWEDTPPFWEQDDTRGSHHKDV